MDTEVARGTTYVWKFIPNDSKNYDNTNAADRIVLWTASSGGGSSPSASTVTVPVSSDTGSVKVDASVSGGTATVKVSDSQIDKVVDGRADRVTVDLSDLKDVDSAKVPAKLISKINDAENTGLTVVLPTGSVTLDDTALAGVGTGKDLTVSVKTLPASKLTNRQKEAVGDQTNVAAVIDVSVTVGTVNRTELDDRKLTSSFPYAPGDGENTSDLTMVAIRSDNTTANRGGRCDAEKKQFTFETDTISRYVLVNSGGPESSGGFTDVPADAWYFDAVNWAAARDITGGVGGGLFGSGYACTRAQIVTFLYRQHAGK